MWIPTLTPLSERATLLETRWGTASGHSPKAFHFFSQSSLRTLSKKPKTQKLQNKQTQQISINNLPLLWFCTNKSDIFRKRNCIFKAHKNRQIQNDMTPWLRSHVALSQIMFLISEMFRYLKASTTLKNCRSFIGWPWCLCSKNALIKRQSDAQVTVERFLICLCKRRNFRHHLGAKLKTINTYGTTNRNGGLKCPLSRFGSSQKCTEYCIFRQKQINCR